MTTDIDVLGGAGVDTTAHVPEPPVPFPGLLARAAEAESTSVRPRTAEAAQPAKGHV
ncbi:hypothetical protein ACIPRD_13395 [Streptomyces sp. NPDC090108]|uniref:hypothetical protein n=1 Tax=Streptomyces sp. NPDC090108 TaxID=3365947 RepID=UPI003827AD4A